MSKKYYTPEIEEFHPGFEYEAKMIDGYWKWHGEVEKRVVTEETDLKTIKQFPDLTRVKHLDREDIESLGAKCKFEGVMLLRETGLMEVFTFKTITIYYSEHTHRCIIQDGPKQESILFVGTIKNKSELKRILKQVGL